MGECDGCANHQRRIEVYSNENIGCGDEFYVAPDVTPAPPTPVDPGTDSSMRGIASLGLIMTSTIAVLF